MAEKIDVGMIPTVPADNMYFTLRVPRMVGGQTVSDLHEYMVLDIMPFGMVAQMTGSRHPDGKWVAHTKQPRFFTGWTLEKSSQGWRTNSFVPQDKS